MSEFNRRNFLKTTAGVAAGAAVGAGAVWRHGRARAVHQLQAREGRQAARAALEAASCRATIDL